MASYAQNVIHGGGWRRRCYARKRFPRLTLRQAADRAAEKGLATLSPKTINSLMGTLSTLMGWGVRDGLLDRNVAERIRVSEPANAKRQARERVRAIMGWTGSGMEEQVYGQGYLARVLASEVEKINYPDLDLRHVHARRKA